MLIFIIFCFCFSIVVAAVCGYWLAGVVAGGFVFLCGLPFGLLAGIIHGFISYSHDRADDRQIMADLNEDFRFDEREQNEDRRTDKLLSASKPSVIHDNRQIHYHGEKNGCK